MLYYDLKSSPTSVTLYCTHAISLFQLTLWHFTCPLHKWPLPCSTGCWALYHTYPFPSAASQPWVPDPKNRRQLQEIVLTLHPLEIFIWHCEKRHQQTRVSLPDFLVLYGPGNRNRYPSVSQSVIKRNLSACGMALDSCIWWESSVEHELVKTSMGLAPSVPQGFCHPQWQCLMRLHSEGPD